MPNETAVLRRGFSRVIRHQRILWWVFAVNFVLGGLGSSGAARALGGALHHSLAGQRLTNTFDLGMFLELVTQPEVKLFSHSGGMILFAGLYFLFLLFVMPGIIVAYLEDRQLTTGEFFSAAGTYFWAFVRLALWSLIPFTLINLLYEGVDSLADYVGTRAVADQTGFYILVIGCIPVLLLLVWVRLWFDMAQVRAVALNELRTRRDVAHAFGLALRRTWPVYWSYIVIFVLINVATAIAVILWAKMPGRSLPLTFILLELVMLCHIFGRLWMKGCVTAWYRLNPDPVATPIEPPMVHPEISPLPPVADIDAPLSTEIEPTPANLGQNEELSR